MFKVEPFTNYEIIFSTFSVGRQATKINPLWFVVDSLARSLNLYAKITEPPITAPSMKVNDGSNYNFSNENIGWNCLCEHGLLNKFINGVIRKLDVT